MKRQLVNAKHIKNLSVKKNNSNNKETGKKKVSTIKLVIAEKLLKRSTRTITPLFIF